ncbi:hypothetical protein TNIN_135321 [Trichonephila inaurata madagascariensis]|uniref:Uncharacterized protein n=1 Tax=Trichonephila inaurata madagascariensis TaxID=2747483 RepID=A0A8X7CQZ6_9ARAC|nr:hypothetical protein TNIN_135321 [Trichonephila inaurata madagascariensis]
MCSKQFCSCAVFCFCCTQFTWRKRDRLRIIFRQTLNAPPTAEAGRVNQTELLIGVVDNSRIAKLANEDLHCINAVLSLVPRNGRLSFTISKQSQTLGA